MIELDKNLLNTFEKGTYYNPAWKHYDNQNANVTCDRCGRSNLKICIGHGQFDLCMACINIISTKCQTPNTPTPPTTNYTQMEQDMYVTKMMQKMYKKKEEDENTLMMQDFFKSSKKK